MYSQHKKNSIFVNTDVRNKKNKKPFIDHWSSQLEFIRIHERKQNNKYFNSYKAPSSPT